MPMLQQFLPGIAAAACGAGAVLAPAALWRKTRWAAPLAAGFGYLCGHLAIAGLPAFPPAEAVQWLPPFALAAMLAGLLHSSRPARLRVRIAVWAPLCAAALFFLLRTKFRSDWPPREGALWLAGLVAGMTLLAACCERIAGDDPALPALLAAIVSGGTSAALMLSGSLLLGGLALGLTVALAISAVAAFFGLSPGRGAVPAIVLLLASLWLSGLFYADLPPASVALLAGAFGGGLIPIGRKMPRWKMFAAKAALTGLVVAGALAVAFHASPPLDY